MEDNILYSAEKRDYATLSMYQEWRTTAFWANVIAVITYVLLSLAALGYLLILIALYFEGEGSVSLFEDLTVSYTVIIYVMSIIQISLYFIINTFLFRFSKSLRMAVEGKDQEVFENAWLNFRNYFRWLGILIIISIVLSAIIVSLLYYIISTIDVPSI